MANRTRYTFYVDEEQLALLTAESERTGAPVSEIIRRTIDDRYGRRSARTRTDRAQPGAEKGD